MAARAAGIWGKDGALEARREGIRLAHHEHMHAHARTHTYAPLMRGGPHI